MDPRIKWRDLCESKDLFFIEKYAGKKLEEKIVICKKIVAVRNRICYNK